MTRPIKALVIGARDDGKRRNIGGELCTRLEAPTWDLRAVVTTNKCRIRGSDNWRAQSFDPHDRQQFRDLLLQVKPDIGFICIPTGDDKGEIALRYANDLLVHDALVSSAEKGTISWQAGATIHNLDRMDVSAAIGGGNRFLYNPKLQNLSGRRVTIYAILNATCNCVSWIMENGGSPDDAVQQAIDRFIAEPPKNGGKLTLKALINGELPDKAMKGTGFHNVLLANFPDDPRPFLSPEDLGKAEASDSDIARIINPFDRRRLIMKVTNNHEYDYDDDDIIVPLKAERGEWRISIGYRSVRDSSIAKWLETVPDINNGVLLYVDGHRYAFAGPGAGRATVDAMIEGALEKWQARQARENAIARALAKVHAV